MTVVQFPITQTARISQWDHTAFDLGPCVHDDCDNPAVFYLDHRPGKQPSIRFTTGEHALKMKRVIEEPMGGNLGEYEAEPRPAPLVCGDCAHGALAALIAHGN